MEKLDILKIHSFIDAIEHNKYNSKDIITLNSSMLDLFYENINDTGKKYVTCNNLTKLTDSGNILPSESSSLSLFFSNVDIRNILLPSIINKLQNNNNNIFLKKRLREESLNVKNIQAFDVNENIYKYYDCIYNLLFSKNKFFLKITALSANTLSNNYAKIEQNNTTLINTIINDTNTINLPYTLIVHNCNKDYINKALLSELINKKQLASKYSLYSLLITEQLTNATNLFDFLKKFSNYSENNNKIIKNIFFQIAFTLELFREYNFVHNDLHPYNIMIIELEQPILLYYVMTNNKGEIDENYNILPILTKYIVKIIDYDRSYDILNNNFKLNVNYNLSRDLEYKFDLFYLCRFLSVYIYRYEKKQKLSDFLFVKQLINECLFHTPDFDDNILKELVDTLDLEKTNQKHIFHKDFVDVHRPILIQCKTVQSFIKMLLTNTKYALYDRDFDIDNINFDNIYRTKIMSYKFNIVKIKDYFDKINKWNKIEPINKIYLFPQIVSPVEINNLYNQLEIFAYSDASLQSCLESSNIFNNNNNNSVIIDLNEDMLFPKTPSLSQSNTQSQNFYYKYLKYKIKYLNQ